MGRKTRRLFHFSDDPEIDLFAPRPVRVPVDRPEGQAWLNGPLVWSIDQAHEFLYLFPRECPRIVVWLTPATRAEERSLWFGNRPCCTIAHIESRWLDRFRAAVVYRYDMPTATFEDIDEVGMWVSRVAIRPRAVEPIGDLPAALEARNVELRVLESLTPLKDVWQTSLHASGIRLRNAAGWGKPSWTHSKPGRQVDV
jgi:hypothetical protein